MLALLYFRIEDENQEWRTVKTSTLKTLQAAEVYNQTVSFLWEVKRANRQVALPVFYDILSKSLKWPVLFDSEENIWNTSALVKSSPAALKIERKHQLLLYLMRLKGLRSYSLCSNKNFRKYAAVLIKMLYNIRKSTPNQYLNKARWPEEGRK